MSFVTLAKNENQNSKYTNIIFFFLFFDYLLYNDFIYIAPRHRATKTPSQFTIDLNLLRTGVEKRTTIMVRNIPNRYTREGLIEDLQEFR